MELDRFSELYRRIRTEPSILLLGQSYLGLSGEPDPIWAGLENEYADCGLSPRVVDYPALWEAEVQQEKDARKLLSTIRAAADRMPPRPELRLMLDLHWSLLYTSAIDKGLLPAAGEGFGISDEPSRQRVANRRFMNKNRRYCVELCNNDDKPILLNSPVTLRRFEHAISQRLDWISDTYLRDYGVLVIDGCNPEHDWLSDELLFGALDSMPYDSIYWFSAPQELPPFAQDLAQRGLLTAERESFIQQLHLHIPELFEESEQEQSVDPQMYASLTLHFKNRRDRVVNIPRSRIAEINGGALCLLDDGILAARPAGFSNRPLAFAQFLAQKGLPSWELFRAAPGNPSFYFTRDKDQALEDAVKARLAIQDGSRRRPLLLEGPSNSGKTMMLANLALKLAAQRKYPVLFLHGDLVAGAEERLQNFLKEWFVKETAFDGERVERILIVWDGNSVQNDQRRYYDLQKQLFTCNVLVVGSCYTTDNRNGICLDPDLSNGELHRLQAVVDSLGGEFRERFQAVIRSGRERIGRQCGQSSLLYLLQTLFRFEFDEEYREVARMLKMQFGQERVFVENSTADRLRRYVEEYNETVAAVARHGGAASYQMKLQLYLQQHFPDAVISPAEQDSLPDKERRHIRMREAVQRLNRSLALAGEFGVLLPSNLLLHLLKDKNGNSYVCYGRETAQLFDVIKNDSLIEEVCISTNRFGDERYYRFRNSLEAENYICLLDDLPMGESSQKRKEREVTILMELMEAANDDEDLMTVIELVR